jgi:hypothetical protein
MTTLLHKFAHFIGWNMCYPDGDGYTCVRCGLHRSWKERR